MTPITDKLAAKWRIEYDNECWPDGEGGSTFEEWWSVTDGRISFKCEYQDDAQMLLAALAAYTSQQAEPSDARVEAPKDWEEAYAQLRDGDAFPPGTMALKVAFVAGMQWQARAVLQAADAVSAGSGWMPIETAPRNELHRDGENCYGPRILVWAPGYDGPMRARWWRRTDSDADNFICDGSWAVFPTHWMHLPAAPGSEQKEGANG